MYSQVNITITQNVSTTFYFSELYGYNPPSNTLVLSPGCGDTSGLSVSQSGNSFIISGAQTGTHSFCYHTQSSNNQSGPDINVIVTVVSQSMASAQCGPEGCFISCFDNFEDFPVGGDAYYPNMFPVIAPPPFLIASSGANTVDILEQFENGNNMLSFLYDIHPSGGPKEMIVIPLWQLIQPGCSITFEFDAVCKPNLGSDYNGSPNLGIFGANGLGCLGYESPTCMSGAVSFCPGIDGFCLTSGVLGSTTNGIPIGVDLITTQHPNAVIEGLNLTHYGPYTWVNNSPLTIGSIVIYGYFDVEPTNSDVTRFFFDNFNVIKECNESVSITPTVKQTCADGKVIVDYEVCLTNQETQTVDVSLMASLDPGTGLTFENSGGFDANGKALISFTPLQPGEPVCTTVTLTINVNSALPPFSLLNINMTANSETLCTDIDYQPEPVSIWLTDCTPEPITCPCTEANTINIVASPGGSDYSDLELLNNYDQNDDGVLDMGDHHGCISISGKLNIDKDLMITGCNNIRMNPCSEIVVEGGVFPAPTQHLTMEYNSIFGCGQMWKGISVSPHGYLTFRHNTIADAEYALYVQPSAFVNFLTPNTQVDIQHNRFERNHVGLMIPGSGANYLGPMINQTPFIGNDFVCKGPGTILGDLFASCDPFLENYDVEYGYAGVVALGTNFNVGLKDATPNTFSNLRNGVIGEKVLLNVDQSNFNNMVGFSDFLPGAGFSRGVGVVSNQGMLNVRDCRFNRAGHAVFSNFNLMSLQRNNTSGVRFGLETFNPFGIGFLQNKDINFLESGIRALNLQQVSFLSGYIIDDNVFATQDEQATNDGDWAVQLLNTAPLVFSNENARITRNQVFLDDQVSGIVVQNIGGWDNINDNYVEFSSHPDGITLTGSGIILQNSGFNYLYNNSVLDVSAPAGATNAFTTSNSIRNIFCCNSTEGTSSGFYFVGSCFGTHFRHSSMTDHDFALWLPANLGGYSVMGRQPVASNQTNSNLFGQGSGIAQNDGPVPILNSSTFRVTDSNTPHYPNFVFTPNGDPNDWFKINEAPSQACDDDPFCPEFLYPRIEQNNFTDSDETIAEIAFGLLSGGAALQWEGERELFARLKKYPELLGQNIKIDAFYTARDAGSVLKSYFEAEQAVASVQNISDNIGELMRLATDSIQAIESDMQASLDKLKDVNQREDSLIIYWQSESQRTRLIQPVANLVNLQHQADSLRKSKALAALPVVQNLPTPSVLQTNLKQSWLVNLEITNSGSAVLSPAQFAMINPIAHQCPLSGGSGVHLARSLYSLNEQKHFDDIELCGIVADRASKNPVGFESEAIHAFPNPTTGHIDFTLPDITDEEIARLSVADVSGQLVYSNSIHIAGRMASADLSTLKTGMYVVWIETNSKKYEPLRIAIIH